MGDNKEYGGSMLVMVPIIVAVIGLVGALGAAVLSNWDKLSPQSLLTQASSGSNTAATPSTTSGARPSSSPIAALRTRGSLFIIASPDAEGASIGARILNELQAEGFRIASGRDGAKLLIEIQAPALEPPQASPIGGLESFSIVTTLTAKVVPKSNDTGDAVRIQRQALGVGATEIEARRNSIMAATDRLGRSIVDTLAVR